MAKQKGLFKVRGTLDDVNFYKSQDGFMIRMKGGVDAARIATDPRFQRTRENNAEFTRAAKASKVLRLALRGTMAKASDPRVSSRLFKKFFEVIQADLVSVRGMRNVIDGESELVSGFEFNLRGKLSTTLFAPFVSTIDRATGITTINIASFVPDTMINASAGSTHYRIMSCGAAIDFEAETFEVDSSETAILPLNALATVAVSQSNTVTAASTKPIFVALGIEFFQEVNGTMYSLKNGAFNALAVVKVDGGV